MTATETTDSTAAGWQRRLSAPVDASSLAMFRILFGVVMLVAMLRLLAKGWVKTLYLDPAFHFPWVSWITPWPGNGMYFHVAALAALAAGIALGCCYRFCAALFFLGFTYLEFLDRTAYLNHYYLVSLLAGLLVFLPAHRKWSVDARLFPPVAGECVPAWSIWLLRFQVGVVFFFAGLAKLNPDWLFAAQPMRTWLMAKSDLPFIGAWLAEPWMAWAASWGGAAYDLSIPFLLLLARTRPGAWAAVVFFHVTTALLFPIGMFPWIMIAATTIFFPPDWPRGFFRRRTSAPPALRPAFPLLPRPAAVLIGAYCLGQVLLPMRSWLYPQQGAWDVRGFNFAWRVMLVEKTGDAQFYEFDPVTGTRERIPTGRYLTARQRMMMAQDPFMIRQFAQFLGRELDVKKTGHEIRAEAVAALNGRPSQPLVRADINLAGELPPDWIVPLNISPPDQPQQLVAL